MLGVYTWSVLITGVFFTGFGFFVYFKNKKELSNKLFGLLSLAFAIWCYAWFALLLVKENIMWAIFWAKILNFGATLIPIFFLHWVLKVLDLNKKRKYLIMVGYIITFLFIIFNYSNLYIKDVHPILFFPFWPTPGILYKWFLLFGYLGMVGYAFIQLIKEFVRNIGEKKYQVGYIIVGSILGFGGGATNFPLMYGIDTIHPIGVFAVGVFAVMGSPFILGYAALRYHLMNIKLIANELFGGVIGLILLINFLTSETLEEWFVRGFLLVLGLIFIILFIRGVFKEVRVREEIERLAQELEKANVRLKKLDEAKSEFVTITSHQLRAPLTAIKGYSSMLLEGSYGKVPEVAQSPLNRIFQSSDRLVRLIGDFLNLSRIERGKMEYDFQKLNLKEMIKGLLDEFKVALKGGDKKLELIFKVDEKEDFTVTADYEKMRQVIGNLIDNAVKYTHQGFVEILLEKDLAQEKVVVKVKDSGIGMNKETLSRIFEKFTRAGEGVFQLHTEGVGLGLYIAKEILKAHDGKIWAESEGVGKGSAFYIELPMKFLTPEEKQKIEDEERKRTESMQGFVKEI